MLDAKLLGHVMKLLTPDEAKKLVVDIAKSGSRNQRQLEQHFNQNGRRVAESLARARSTSGNSIYDLNDRIKQHIETISFISEHLNKLPKNLRQEFEKVVRAASDEFESIGLYKSIQEQHFVLGLLPKRLLDKIIDINTIEKKVKQTSKSLQLFFDKVLEEILKYRQTPTTTKKPLERSNSRPLSNPNLNIVLNSIEKRANDFTGNVSKILLIIKDSLKSEAKESKPDLESLKEQFAIKLTELKQQGVYLDKQDTRKIRLLLHPDLFEKEEEIQSIANGLSAIFNRVMTTK